jgi:hypothetical protein
VISLNAILRLPASVGARTALELQGFGHYLRTSGAHEVHLYVNEKMPAWVSHVSIDARLVFHRAAKLFKTQNPSLTEKTDASVLTPSRSPSSPSSSSSSSSSKKSTTTTPAAPPLASASLTQQPWGHWHWPLILSTPERAILELLDEVPDRETFHQADVLMEGLRNLSPKRLEMLLEDCKSIKVKRLFFWFAERHNHAWLEKLDRSGVDLGRGKRMLVRGGKLDTKYNITVPENLDGGS